MTAPAPPRPPVPMDPRIRARRVEVTRTEGRRRLRLLLIAVGCLTTVGTAVGATRSPLLDIDRVVVTGNAQTPHADVVAAGGLEPGVQMFDLDAARAASDLAALPWVRRAQVVKEWPGTVRVVVVERVPAAAVEAGAAGWALVDKDGRVLALQPAPPPELPIVTGVDAPGPPGTTLSGLVGDAVAVATALPDAVRAAVPRVSVAGDELELRPAAAGPTVRFGPPSETAAKVLALQALFAEVDLRRVRTIDVRVPSAPVLTRA